jgi:hypothetical protein
MPCGLAQGATYWGGVRLVAVHRGYVGLKVTIHSGPASSRTPHKIGAGELHAARQWSGFFYRSDGVRARREACGRSLSPKQSHRFGFGMSLAHDPRGSSMT